MPKAKGKRCEARSRRSTSAPALVLQLCDVIPRLQHTTVSTCCNWPRRPPTVEIRVARLHNGQPPPARRYRPRGADSGDQMATTGATPFRVASNSEVSTPMARAASAAGRATALRFLRRQPQPWRVASARRCSCKAGRPPSGGGGLSLRGPFPQCCPATYPIPKTTYSLHTSLSPPRVATVPGAHSPQGAPNEVIPIVLSPVPDGHALVETEGDAVDDGLQLPTSLCTRLARGSAAQDARFRQQQPPSRGRPRKRGTHRSGQEASSQAAWRLSRPGRRADCRTRMWPSRRPKLQLRRSRPARPPFTEYQTARFLHGHLVQVRVRRPSGINCGIQAAVAEASPHPSD